MKEAASVGGLPWNNRGQPRCATNTRRGRYDYFPSHLCTTYMSVPVQAANAANVSKAPTAVRIMARISC